ncbi:MAG: hypothetical protein K9J27_05975 [Bacteroidales bacterium]|nr:hypothetical protein [Bacteroidales bacterium]MCF8333571.1 hypothetical protein [Bacteroidales bacterium]
MQRTIIPDIEQIKRDMDSSLDDKDFRKITKYYGLAVPAILGEGFCLLHGRRLTEKERTALTYLGGLTGLFDDFFDKKQTPERHIKELVDRHDERDAQDDNEKLFVRFFNTALDNIIHSDVFMQYVDEVFAIQMLSWQQSLPDIPSEKIKDITFKKGGYSLLFYRSALDEYMGSLEKAMTYKLGSLLQLENDLFDVYKDYKQSIKTLVTTETQINKLRHTYMELMEETVSLVKQTPFAEQNKKAFLRFISLITHRGSVGLDQLEAKQKTTSHTFLIHAYNRKDLICDMEKPKNILRVIHYYAKGWKELG